MTSVSTITIVGVQIMNEKLKRTYQEWDLGKAQGTMGEVGSQL